MMGSIFQSKIRLPILERYSEKIINFVPKLFVAVLIIIAFCLLNKIVEKILNKLWGRLKLEKAVEQLLTSVTKTVIIGFGVITALGQLGVNVGSLIAGVGVVSFAVSFAAKDTLENLIAGITILIDKPFCIGNFIEVEGACGIVTNITLRTTRLKTKENYVKVVPNSKIVSSLITNRSIADITKVYLTIGISYESDIEKAREVIIKTFEGDKRLIDGLPVNVYVEALADSSVNLGIVFSIKDSSLVFPLKFEYYEKIKDALTLAEIDIPYPVRTVYIKNN